MTRADLLVVSNGHGEDTIGAALVAALRMRLPALRVEAFPLVGVGSAYGQGDVVGPGRALPAGGLTLHHPSLLLEDLRAGIVGLTLCQLRFLRRQRPAAVLVVGDAYAQALAALVRAPRAVLQPLVSVLQERPMTARRLNRVFMESIRAPERLLLSAADRVYTRDEATAQSLRDRGVAAARYLGNPIMDGLAAAPLVERGAAGHGVVLALLPGSRGYARTSVAVMIEAVERLAALLEPGARVLALVAWTLGDRPGLAPGWRPEPRGGPAAEVWVKGEATVWWVERAFASVLASADAVLGTAGTANEQAAGLGLPVVAFAVPPYYGRAFLENQERLLGGALRVVDATPAAVAAAALAAVSDGVHARTAARVGPARLGGHGGTAAVANDLTSWLTGLGLPASPPEASV